MMELDMIRRRSASANREALEKTAAISARIGNEEMSDRLRWSRSYVIKECPTGRWAPEASARRSTAISEHAHRAGMPGDDFLPIAATVVVRPDPGAP
jgi:hypothetical protein